MALLFFLCPWMDGISQRDMDVGAIFDYAINNARHQQLKQNDITSKVYILYNLQIILNLIIIQKRINNHEFT